MRRSMILLGVISLLVIQVFILPPTPHAVAVSGTEEWSMIGYDSTRANLSNNTGPAAPVGLVWNSTDRYIVRGTPVVACGSVFYVSLDGNVYALNATTGTRQWNCTIGHYIDNTSPCVSNGILYVGSDDCNVYALNASTGAKLWNYTTPGAAVYSPPAVSEGYVYIGSNDRNLYCLEASTGTEIWNYTTTDPVQSAPAIAYGCVFFGGGGDGVEPEDGNVYCLNATTGQKIWNYTTGYAQGWFPPGTPPHKGIETCAVTNGCVYASSVDDNIYCFDAANGSKLWSTGILGGDFAVGDNLVYVAVNSRYDCWLSALNASTGTLVWRGSAINYYSSMKCPIITGDFLYVGTGYGVSAVNKTNGEFIWNCSTRGDDTATSVVVANGYLYIGLVWNLAAISTMTDISPSPSSSASLTPGPTIIPEFPNLMLPVALVATAIAACIFSALRQAKRQQFRT